MYNLLSNAFKFTVKGTITVSAVLHKCKIHKRSCVRFSVEDSGAGIASVGGALENASPCLLVLWSLLACGRLGVIFFVGATAQALSALCPN